MEINYNQSLLEEGLYRVTSFNFEEGGLVKTKGGKCPTMDATYKIKHVPVNQRYINYRFLLFPGNRKLEKLFKSALGEVPTKMETDDLIGKEIIIEIAHNEKDGKVFANVVDFFAIDEVDESLIINQPEDSEEARFAVNLFTDTDEEDELV